MGGAAGVGHITPAIVIVPINILTKGRRLKVAMSWLILTPNVHCVVPSVLRQYNTHLFAYIECLLTF